MFLVVAIAAAIAGLWALAIAVMVRRVRAGDGKRAVAELIVDSIKALFE